MLTIRGPQWEVLQGLLDDRYARWYAQQFPTDRPFAAVRDDVCAALGVARTLKVRTDAARIELVHLAVRHGGASLRGPEVQAHFDRHPSPEVGALTLAGAMRRSAAARVAE